MAVAQLYKYEKFPEVFTGIGLPGGVVWSPIYAALIVTGEVLALPFLLRMSLSPAMRLVSMVAGWLVVAGWLAITITTNVAGYTGNSGILGATLPTVSGWWTVCLFMVLGVLAGWCAWTMWPCRSVATKH